MNDSILVIENYPGRGDCIVRLLRQFGVPFELMTSDGKALTLPPSVAGVVLSGGPQSVTKISSEEGVRLRPVLELLDAADQLGLPVLGICLGHQLLGTWVGGKVTKLPSKVVGFQEVCLRKSDGVFAGFSEVKILAFQYHEDQLCELPSNCEVLATSDTCQVEAFRVRDRLMWGVQFHPEVTFSDGGAILDGQPPPLHTWKPHADVKAPYIIKTFAEVCLKSLEI